MHQKIKETKFIAYENTYKHLNKIKSHKPEQSLSDKLVQEGLIEK